MLPESRTIGFRLSLKYSFFEGVLFFLNRISIRTAITLSKLLAVVRSEMCTQGLIGWITFFWSSVLTDSYYLGLRTPLDMRMPISSVPFSDCPIENGLSTISCVTLITMIEKNWEMKLWSDDVWSKSVAMVTRGRDLATKSHLAISGLAEASANTSSYN